MSVELDRESFILRQLLDAPDYKLAKLPGTKTNPRELGLDAPTKNGVEAGLKNRNLISVDGTGKNKRYVLTPDGIEEAKKRVWPPMPLVPPKFKAFVLLNLLAAGDHTLTLKQVKSLLTPANASALESPKPKTAALMNALAGEQVVEKRAREAEAPDDRVAFRLTDAGTRDLIGGRQHVDIEFKLTGAAINRLIESANGHPADALAHSPTARAIPRDERPAVQPHGASLSDENLLREARDLMTRHTNGMLPIYELRRHVKQKFGERAGGIDEFDKRLKRLRGQRLDLISLHDPTPFSRDQLNEGVQGVDELFFYVRNLR